MAWCRQCVNFDALAQGNAYKPTKEPINYRGPGGDRTHDLQTEATPPAASCPARTLHATEIAPKNATPMTCPWLHWTTDNLSGMHMVSISTPVCVNFELRPGAGDIHICWFNFDALAQGNLSGDNDLSPFAIYKQKWYIVGSVCMFKTYLLPFWDGSLWHNIEIQSLRWFWNVPVIWHYPFLC